MCPGFGTGSVEAERRAWSFVGEAGRAVKESLLEAGSDPHCVTGKLMPRGRGV